MTNKRISELVDELSSIELERALDESNHKEDVFMSSNEKILKDLGYNDKTLKNMTEEDMESEVDLLSSGGM